MNEIFHLPYEPRNREYYKNSCKNYGNDDFSNMEVFKIEAFVLTISAIIAIILTYALFY
jgi:hypothetical protein